MRAAPSTSLVPRGARPCAHPNPRARADFDALYAYLSTSNYDFNYGVAHHGLKPTRPSLRA